MTPLIITYCNQVCNLSKECQNKIINICRRQTRDLRDQGINVYVLISPNKQFFNIYGIVDIRYYIYDDNDEDNDIIDTWGQLFFIDQPTYKNAHIVNSFKKLKYNVDGLYFE